MKEKEGSEKERGGKERGFSANEEKFNQFGNLS